MLYIFGFVFDSRSGSDWNFYFILDWISANSPAKKFCKFNQNLTQTWNKKIFSLYFWKKKTFLFHLIYFLNIWIYWSNRLFVDIQIFTLDLINFSLNLCKFNLQYIHFLCTVCAIANFLYFPFPYFHNNFSILHWP